MNPSLGPLARPWPRPPSRAVPALTLPVAQGPETGHYTPSALCEGLRHWFLKDARRLILSWGGYCLTRTLRDRESRKRLQGRTCAVSW